MHELSIANSLIEVALEQLQNSQGGADVRRVSQLNLRIGALTCVHRDALHFSFDLVASETALAGARLHINEVPVAIFCPNCSKLQTLAGIQSFRCPECQMLSADIRQGRELELESIEFEECFSSAVCDSKLPLS